MRTYLAVWASFAVIVAYIASYFILGPLVSKNIVNVLLLGTAITISMSWGPAAMRAFKRGIGDDVSKIVLAIWLSWTALIVQRIYIVALSIYDRPSWLVDTPLPGISAILILIAGTYAVIAPGNVVNVPKREISWIIIAATIAGIIMGGTSTALIIHYNL